LVADASVIVEKEDHCEDVALDQPNNIMKKDDSIPSYSLSWDWISWTAKVQCLRPPLYLIKDCWGK